jgi:hypothetical protein
MPITLEVGNVCKQVNESTTYIKLAPSQLFGIQGMWTQRKLLTFAQVLDAIWVGNRGLLQNPP